MFSNQSGMNGNHDQKDSRVNYKLNISQCLWWVTVDKIHTSFFYIYIYFVIGGVQLRSRSKNNGQKVFSDSCCFSLVIYFTELWNILFSSLDSRSRNKGNGFVTSFFDAESVQIPEVVCVHGHNFKSTAQQAAQHGPVQTNTQGQSKIRSPLWRQQQICRAARLLCLSTGNSGKNPVIVGLFV